MNKAGKIEKRINYIILAVSVLLGFSIAAWTTSIQAAFLETIGVSPWGALTIEPLLIITSFLLGLKITRTHRLVSSAFITILMSISLLCMVSMYTKKSYVTLEARKSHAELAGSSIESEKAIRRALDSLTDRQLSGKKTLQMVDRLQKQESRTEAHTEAAGSDIQAIVDTISGLLKIGDRGAILLFSILVSLSAVFSPSFLFFSAGMMIRNTGLLIKGNNHEKYQGLSVHQKAVLLVKDNITDDVKEMANFLGTSERVIKSQLSRIERKKTG